MKWLAIDIGGANLKAADGRGFAASSPFALWRSPRRLAHELRTLIAESPRSDHLVVTMSGELADCFETKSDGVRHIIQAVSEAADSRHTRIYTLEGKLVTPQLAARTPRSVAAANWHALARFATRLAAQRPALVLDIGSTTCDIVPLVQGQLAARATDDTARLQAGELVYTGVDRTPVCAIASETPFRGQPCPLAGELFATARDVYVVLSEFSDEETNVNTADGRPATKANARRRLARMICADKDQFNHRDAVTMAQALANEQGMAIVAAIQKVIQNMPVPPEMAILAGQGEFLGKRVLTNMKLNVQTVSLSEKLGTTISRCAPAHALAVLAREAVGGAGG